MDIEESGVWPEAALQENARLQSEVKRAQSIAQAATEELKDFVYAVSHDVKEALRSVSSYSQLLVRHAPADPELAEYSQFVTEGVRSAVAILDRMNMFARIDTSPGTTTLRLTIPIQMAVLKLQQFISSSGASVTYGSLP